MFQPHVESAGGTLDLSKPSAKGLAHILRDKALWPKDFGDFDFSKCDKCAMGIARRTWESSEEGLPNSMSTATLLGIGESVAAGIFCFRGIRERTPEAIAEDLDALV